MMRQGEVCGESCVFMHQCHLQDWVGSLRQELLRFEWQRSQHRLRGKEAENQGLLRCQGCCRSEQGYDVRQRRMCAWGLGR